MCDWYFSTILQIKMYSIYKQTHPPTGIEHCVYCNFFNLTERNLVISAVNKLYVYRLNPDTEVGILWETWLVLYPSISIKSKRIFPQTSNMLLLEIKICLHFEVENEIRFNFITRYFLRCMVIYFLGWKEWERWTQETRLKKNV